MRWLLQVAVGAAVVTVLAALAIDEPFARWLATRETWPALWNDTIAVLEYPLGIEPWKWSGVCLLVAGSLVTLLVPRLRTHASLFLIVTLTHLLARNASWTLKWATGRLRPSQWLKQDGDTWLRDGGFSFPSGHVLLFASIVIPIVLVYPRMRPLLAIVAFVMAARVAVNAHFVADVFGGLALTALFTWLSAVVVRRVLPSQIQPACLR